MGMVPVLSSSIDEWEIRQQIRWLVFGTNASNTGLKTGACTFIEHSLDHKMAWLACRHHVMELVIASIFQAVFGRPDVVVFKRLQTSWPYTYQSAYETASDDMFDSCTAVLRAEMENFCKVALEESQPREDYKEFLNLCMISLGGTDPTEVSFRAPGAFHQMHAQNNLQYEVVLVPAPVHFD